MPLVLEIVTPEAKVFSTRATEVVLPAQEGEVGILPGHIPLITMLVPGEVMVNREDGTREFLAIDGGFAEVRSDRVTVLTEAAIEVETIDLEEVEEAQRKAQEALETAEESGLDPDEVERLERITRFAVAQRLARGRRR